MNQSTNTLYRIIEDVLAGWKIPAAQVVNQLPPRTLPPASGTDRGGVLLSTTAGAALGVAAAGTGTSAARADHVHPRESYICIWEQQTAGTDGGTFTSGAWRTRVLTTEHADTGGHASIASNQITLAAGTYRARIVAPSVLVDPPQATLRDVAGAETTILVGGSVAAPAPSIIVGRFTLAGTAVLEIQHQCQTTRATDGLGAAANFGEVEKYVVCELVRE